MDILFTRKRLREKLFFSIKYDLPTEKVQENLENYFFNFQVPSVNTNHRRGYFAYCSSNLKSKVFYILKDFRINSYCEKNKISIDEMKQLEMPFFVYDELGNSFHYTNEILVETGDGQFYLESADHELASCYNCDENFIREEMVFSDHHQADYCSTCYHENHDHCEGCDQDYHHDEDRDCSCNDEEEETTSGCLSEYNERNELFFLTQPKKEAEVNYKNFFYGIELECEMREGEVLSETVDKMKDCFNSDHILFKRDGSLNYGFEIVSTNATFNYHKNLFWKSFFENDFTNEVKGYHAKSCGMHIHFNKNAFSNLDIRKLNAFYHNIYNRDFITTIAGRQKNDYAKFYDDIDLKSEIWVDRDSYYKYRCINLSNISTIEIRIFQSNLKENSFFRNLEFVDSVNHFIKETSINHLGYQNYLTWLLQDTKKSYFNLYEFLQKNFYFELSKNFKPKGFKNLLSIIESENKKKCA